MYPEVEGHGIIVSLDFSEEKNDYIVKFKKSSININNGLIIVTTSSSFPQSVGRESRRS